MGKVIFNIEETVASPLRWDEVACMDPFRQKLLRVFVLILIAINFINPNAPRLPCMH